MKAPFEFRSGTVWTFKTKRFKVALTVRRDRGYRYDGHDPEGETQAKLKSGEYVAFDSLVSVELDGRPIASEWLCGSVYGRGDANEFWTAHRDSDDANRNTLAMKASGRVICHYFPDMVRQAIAQARATVGVKPRLRIAA